MIFWERFGYLLGSTSKFDIKRFVPQPILSPALAPATLQKRTEFLRSQDEEAFFNK